MVGKRPEDAYSDQRVAAEAFGNMNLAMPPSPRQGMVPPHPNYWACQREEFANGSRYGGRGSGRREYFGHGREN